MSKATRDMTKRELAEVLADRYTQHRDWALREYMAMTKGQLLEQVEYVRGERAQSDLTYKYDN